MVNDFSIAVATVNGTGSQTANLALLRAIFKMGVPVSGKNIFPSNIQGQPTWFYVRLSPEGYEARKAISEVLVAFTRVTADADIASLPPIELYEIDGVARFEAELSDGLADNPEAARRLAQERIGQIDGSRLDVARRSAAGLINAAESGVDRYPAIVFDGNAVVYGVTDIGAALRQYRQWKDRAPR